MFKYVSALVAMAGATITNDMTIYHSNHSQGQSRSSANQKLTVHLVHHTHDDVGWLKTVDEYYSGIDD